MRGMNGRCVYCDHGEQCHPGTGATYNLPLGTGHRDAGRGSPRNTRDLGTDMNAWQRRVKGHYARLFGLPAEQIRFFGELTPDQVDEVRWHYSAGLVDVDNYVYAVKRDGHLVVNRVRRELLTERGG